jgi:pimeloyl-ACP methyl ester carboxylesterase
MPLHWPTSSCCWPTSSGLPGSTSSAAPSAGTWRNGWPPERLAAVRDKEADTLKAEAMGRLEASPAGELRDVLLDLVGRHQPADLLKSRMLGVQMAKPVPQIALPEDRILLIECDNDPLVAPPVREAMRQHYAGARCETIRGGGHYPYLVKAAEYNAAITRFLS